MVTLLERLQLASKTFVHGEEGEDVVEYSILFALVSIILLTTVSTLSEQIDTIFARIVATF